MRKDHLHLEMDSHVSNLKNAYNYGKDVLGEITENIAFTLR